MENTKKHNEILEHLKQNLESYIKIYSKIINENIEENKTLTPNSFFITHNNAFNCGLSTAIDRFNDLLKIINQCELHITDPEYCLKCTSQCVYNKNTNI